MFNLQTVVLLLVTMSDGHVVSVGKQKDTFSSLADCVDRVEWITKAPPAMPKGMTLVYVCSAEVQI